MQLSKKGEFIRALVVLAAIPTFIGLRYGGGNKFSVIILLIVLIGIPLFIAYYGLKKFRYLIILNSLLAISWLISIGYSAFRPNTLFQILFMFLFLYLLIMSGINIFSIFWLWYQEYGFLSLLPIAFSDLIIPLSFQADKIGHQLRMRFFENHLTEYEQVVQTIEDQYPDPNIPIPPVEIPPQYKHLAYLILAKWEKSDVLVVDFAWGISFPSKHSAFEYRSDDSIPDPVDWSFHERINENWFRVSD